MAWARNEMAALTGDCLDDPRVTVTIGDVASVIAAGGSYDAILLDVDNGPDGLTRDANDGCIRRAGWPRQRRHFGLAESSRCGRPRPIAISRGAWR